MAVIADPQLTDAYSYHQSGFALHLTQFYSDLYMQRAFAALQTSFQPNGILFLGDLMDGGREWVLDQEERCVVVRSCSALLTLWRFAAELERFKKRVFPVRDPAETKVYYMAGMFACIEMGSFFNLVLLHREP